VSIFSLVYAGLTLTSIPALRAESNGPSLVIFLLCVVWAGDITALYVGRAWGRHKLAPVLSPNKTWEGSLGSVAGSLLVAGVLLGLAALLEIWNSTKLSYSDDVWWYWLLLAVVVNVAAQLGDWPNLRSNAQPGSRIREICCPVTAASWTASTPCCWPLQ